MSDTYSPLLLTIAADGRVTADFEGHISAEGLDLDMGETATPPEDRKIRWLRASDGTRLAEIYAWHGGAGFPEHALLSLRAYDRENLDSNAELEVNAGGDGSLPSRVLAVAGLQSRVIVRGDGASDFVQRALVDAAGDLIVATGADTVARKAKGAEGRVLRVEASEADGLVWASAALKQVAATSDVGTGASTAEIALHSTTVPADLLAAGTIIKVWASGATTGSAAARRARLYIGNTLIAEVVLAAGADAGGDYILQAVITVRGAASEAVWSLGHKNTTGGGVAGVLVWANNNPGVAEAIAGGLVVKLNGSTDNAADEVTSQVFVVEVTPP